MAFCFECGTKLPEGSGFCPNCGAPVAKVQAPQQPPVAPQQPQYAPQQPQVDPEQTQFIPQQPQVAPQQPQYAPQQPQAAPQQPQYAPQQPQYAPQQPQYAAPQQPQYAAPQQPTNIPNPMGDIMSQPKEKIQVDYLPSANSSKMMIFTIIGLTGVLFSIINLFMSPVSYSYYSGVKINYAYAFFALASSGCTGAAMFYLFDSLKKGMVNLPTPLTSLLQWCSWLVLATQGLGVLSALLLFISAYGATGVLSIFTALVAIGYLVLYIIVGVKLMTGYTGKLKLLGILFIAIPGASIILSLLGTVGGGIAGQIIFGVPAQLGTAYIYYLAHEIVTGKRLV